MIALMVRLFLFYAVVVVSLIPCFVGCSSGLHQSYVESVEQQRAQQEKQAITKTIKLSRIASEPRGQIRYEVYFLCSDELPETVLTGTADGETNTLPILKQGDRVTVKYLPDGRLLSVKLASQAAVAEPAVN